MDKEEKQYNKEVQIINEEALDQSLEVAQAEGEALPPMGFEVIRREFVKDKAAIVALFVFITIILIAFIGAMIVDHDAATKVDLFSRYAKPGENGFILGAEEGGRDVLSLLIIGTRNSIFIGFAVTIITSIISIALGIIAGYYGGFVEDIMMRIVDFIIILPPIVLIIVIVTIVRRFDLWSLIAILSALGWAGGVRLFRTSALSEASKDYISASKTMGTPDWKIMYLELMPNLSSLIITSLTLGLSGNIGIETGLTFLGFGLPSETPSLGTLIAAANNPDVIQNKVWVWLPAVGVILALMLSINYMGQAFQRVADSKQRLG